MKIASITLVRNESDIIELFVRHTLNFVDAMYIVNNLSTDNTNEILLKLQEEGLPITIYQSNSTKHASSQTILSVLSKIKDADYVVPIDADEFFSCSSREELHSDISNAPPNSIPRMRWKTYLPSSLDVKNVLVECVDRLVEEPTKVTKIIIPKCYFDGIYFNPSSDVKDIYYKDNLCQNYIIDTKLCHFPIRSKDQAILKFLTVYTTFRFREDFKGKDNGFQNKNAVDKFRKVRYNISLDDLRDCVFSYFDTEVNKDTVKEPMIIPENVYTKYETQSDLIYNLDMYLELNVKA